MGGIATPFQGGFVPPGAPGSPEAGGPPPTQQPPQPPADQMGAMVGGDQLAAPDPAEHLKSIMRKYRQVELEIKALAMQSGPETAPGARKAMDGLREMMEKAMARPNAVPEPAAPRSLG